MPQYTDLFTVVPTDGWINGIRSNNPYGEVQAGTETQITNNGSALGSSSITIPGYTGSVFEPIDAYKGDLARGYFYMATRYEDGIGSWESFTTASDAVLDGTAFPAYEQWMIDLLLSWHNSDPVDQKEIDRNEAIYAIQGNRNPFIDHPEYAALIWDNCGSGGDTEAPTAPTNLTAANTSENSTDLSWTSSNDNVGVVGYRVYQDGNLVITTANTFANISSLNTSTTYDFYVTAYDAAGNTSANSNTVSVTTADLPGGPTVLHEGYFETGWDGWQDGGSDCRYYTGTRSPEGNSSIRIRDNSGTASAMTSPVFDLQAYTSVTVDFSFYANSMENNEDFWLRYNDGSGWQTVATFIRGVDFNNNTTYDVSVTLDDNNYTFPANAQFRFQCDASGNNDQIYIDAVVITGETASSSGLEAIILTEALLEEEMKQQGEETIVSPTIPLDFEKEDEVLLYPNPASSFINVDLHGYHSEVARIEIFNSLGQALNLFKAQLDDKILQYDLSHLPSGVYFLRVTNQLGEVQAVSFYVR